MASDLQIIGIAVVHHGDRFLVGVRAADGPLAGFAEFPGGKQKPGETIEDCVRRECLEETGLHVNIEERLLTNTFRYDHGTLEVHFTLCSLSRDQDVAVSHEGFRWVLPAALSSLNFPPANDSVVSQLIVRFG